MNNEPSLLTNQHVINAGSMAVSLSSGVINISEFPGFCVHAIWSGDPVGNITVEGSNDGTNFKVIDTQAAGGAAGQYLDNKADQHYCYVKVNYTRSSGTGLLDCYLSAKRN